MYCTRQRSDGWDLSFHSTVKQTTPACSYISLKRVHSFGYRVLYILYSRPAPGSSQRSGGGRVTIRAKLQSKDGVFAMFRRWVCKSILHLHSSFSQQIKTHWHTESTSKDLTRSHTSISISTLTNPLKVPEVTAVCIYWNIYIYMIHVYIILILTFSSDIIFMNEYLL